MLTHGGSYLGCGVRNGITDRSDDFGLNSGWDTEGGCDEFPQGLARCPGLTSHETDTRRIVLVAGIHRGGEDIVRRCQMNVGTLGIQQCDVFRVAVGVTDSVGQQQQGRELAKGLYLVIARNMITDCLGYTFPSGIVLCSGT